MGNAAEYCRRENLFKRHIYIPLGTDEKMGADVTMKFKEGRAHLSGITDAGKKNRSILLRWLRFESRHGKTRRRVQDHFYPRYVHLIFSLNKQTIFSSNLFEGTKHF